NTQRTCCRAAIDDRAGIPGPSTEDGRLLRIRVATERRAQRQVRPVQGEQAHASIDGTCPGPSDCHQPEARPGRLLAEAILDRLLAEVVLGWLLAEAILGQAVRLHGALPIDVVDV